METRTLLLTLLCGAALCEDLSGKQFTFPDDPKHENVPHVTLHLDVSSVPAMTVCLRFFSQLQRTQGLFSLATRDHPNAIMLMKYQKGNYKVHVASSAYDFQDLPTHLLDWNSVCWTWASASGLTQLWLNGLRTSQKLVGLNYDVSGDMSVIVGQEQDDFQGGYNPNDSFEGDLTDLHMWSSVVPACEIRSYMNQGSFRPGDLLSWSNLSYTVSGNVYVQDSDFKEPVC